MEKKIVELSLTEIQAVAGGIKVPAPTSASLSVNAHHTVGLTATMARYPQPAPSPMPARYEALLARG